MPNITYAATADGAIIEVHHQPELAYSDGQQTLNFQEFASMQNKIQSILQVLQ